MRIWIQFFSSREGSTNLHKALEEHFRSAVEPGVEIEIHGTRRGGLAEQYHLLQTVDTQDVIDNVLKCKEAKGDQKYDAFVIGNANDPGLYEAREILQIPVLGFLETTSHVACMMGNSFSMIDAGGAKFELDRIQLLKRYGLMERLTSIEMMDYRKAANIPNSDPALTDPAVAQLVLDEFDRVARRAVEKGAEVIIPCGGLLEVLTARRGTKEIDGALIMNGYSVLMSMTEAAIKIQRNTGTFVSRKLLYKMPEEDLRDKIKSRYGIDYNPTK